MLVTPPHSDESSGDEANDIQRKLPEEESLFPTDGNNQMSFEPISFQLPATVQTPMQMFPPVDVIAQPALYAPPPADLSANDMPVAWQDTDDVLDQAVQELFRNDMLTDGMEDLERFWDTSLFGDDNSLQDDFQLGYMLDKMLEEV